MTADNHEEAVRKAQRIRLRRMLWGFASQACTLVIVLGLYAFDMLPAARVSEFLLMVLAINLVFFLILRTGVNLRFRDPSMTAAQIVVALWPAVYLMLFVTEPQARMPFLFIATGGLLFGMFALNRRGMLLVGATIVLAYVLLLTGVQLRTPERVDWRIESLIIFAYAVVLLMVAYIGSHIAGLRLKLKEQNRRLEILATRDPLTHLPNRRSLLDQLTREVSRCERRSPQRDALCISMLDIDHFKRINDAFGHDVGDAVLCRVGTVLQASMREGDFIGRFGGEEFVLVFPETTLEASEAAAERVRVAVAAQQFDELPAAERITVSQGVALHREGDSIESTLKRADEALYQAKSAGRDRIIIGR